MVLLVASSLTLTGCSIETDSFTSWLRNPEGNTAAEFTEPQGNSQDFLIQDYDVKEVEEDTIDALEPFDTSGPTYAGVAEIVADDGAAGSGTTTDEDTVVISTMHTQSKTGGGTQLQNWICKSPGAQGEVWEKIKDTGINGVYDYHGKENANDLLRIAYVKCNGKRQASDPVTDEMVQEFKSIVGTSSSSGLRGSNKVVTGYSYKSSAFKVENAIADRLNNVLTNDGYTPVYTKNSSTAGLDFVDKATAGQENYAKCHIIIWSRAATEYEKPGWMIFYNDASEHSSASMALASYLAEALDDCQIASALEDGYVGTGQKFGDSDHYTILNWSEVPTIILVVGDYNDTDVYDSLNSSTVQEEFVDALVTAIEKL